MSTIKLDSYKEFSPQNLIDEVQKMIDKGRVEDILIITRKNDDIYFMASPMTDSDSIGLLEMTKMRIFQD